MSEQIIRFYELSSAKFQADPLLLVAKIAQKAFETQASCVILATDEAQAMALDEKLWSYIDDAFYRTKLPDKRMMMNARS